MRKPGRLSLPESPWLAILVGLACFAALHRLGYEAGVRLALTVAIFAGGLVELPIGRLRIRSAGGSNRESATFRIGVNLGGCLIPLGVAIERGFRLSASSALPLGIAVVLVALLSLFLARPVARFGVVLAWPLTGLLAGALGLTLGRDSGSTAAFAFVAGLVGPLLGADLTRGPALARLGALRAGIGGDGAYDGLLWSALLAAILGATAGPWPVGA